jgi:hypothetical protein
MPEAKLPYHGELHALRLHASDKLEEGDDLHVLAT